MHPNFHVVCVFVMIIQYVCCFYNTCDNREKHILSDDECSELYFEPSEKENNLGIINIRFNQNSLNITPTETPWDTAYLRMTMYNNQTNKLCSKLNKKEASYCIKFTPQAINETFLLEYKLEKLPETTSKKFLFSIPGTGAKFPIFTYVDFTDTSCLILRAQKVATFTHVSHYKIEVYKERNNVTTLQDLQFFAYANEIVFEYFTYNNEGHYFFTITVFDDDCIEDLCPKITTPKIFIGRKSTRLVIGIVGASFILPFVLFVFHILTKKYQIDGENQSKPEDRMVIVYKSSFKKHNEVVFALARLLEKLYNDEVVLDVIDLSKTKKFPDKFCNDSIILANHVIYVAPPRHETDVMIIDQVMSYKEIYAVIFDYCTDKLPIFFDNHKIFKIFNDFDKFIDALNISESYDNPFYSDLRRKTEEAKIETDRLADTECLPKIVVTDSEPQEYDSLISPKNAL